MKNIETIKLDPQIIERKLKELRSMLVTVKSSKSSPPHMVPLIETAIEANENTSEALSAFRICSAKRRSKSSFALLVLTHGLKIGIAQDLTIR